jgi:hypothetical protein
MQDAPPLILEDPALAAALPTSGHAQQLTAPFAHEDPTDTAARTARAEEVAAAYAVTPRHWKDIPLAPFAISREADWLLHRTALGCPPLEQLIQQPQAMLSDALRVLWFLAHDPVAWLSLPSMREVEGRWQPRTAHDRALELEATIRAWADEHVSNDEHALAVLLFYEIYNGTRETRTSVKPSKDHDVKKLGN